jgi:phosphotransferase family enzyme
VNERVALGDDGVARPAYPWTQTIHALLRHIRGAGFESAPIPLALEEGRETLSMIVGDSGALGWAQVVPDGGLVEFARLLREYHDATRGFRPPDPCRWAFRDGPPELGEVVCHGDFGPWNVVWRDGRPVGLLDFDFAEPGDPVNDIAYALDYVAPFCDDEEAQRWRSHPAPPDRRKRIGLFLEAYGGNELVQVVDAVIARRELDIDHVRLLADRSFEPQRRWVEGGMLEELAERIRWLRANRHLFE